MTALPTTIAEGRRYFARHPAAAQDLSAGGTGTGSGAAIRQQGLCVHASDDRDRGCIGLLSRSHRAADRRRHGAERRTHHARRSGPVPCHRAPAADRSVPRLRPVLSAASGRDGCRVDRDTADPSELSGGARRRLLPRSPAFFITRSSRGRFATLVRGSRIRHCGMCRSGPISNRRTRRPCSSASTRRRRAGRAHRPPKKGRRSGSAAAPRRSRSRMPTAT